MKHKAGRINLAIVYEPGAVIPRKRATQFQMLAREVYSNGDFIGMRREQFERAGDSLFTFLMSELDEDCKDFDEALRRLEQARDDIEVVIDAFLRRA